MEQYLKKLVEDAVNSSHKQKNSTGSKTPRPSLPIQTNKGRKNKTPKHHQRINKKRKPYPESDSDNDTKTTESQSPTAQKNTRYNPTKEQNNKHRNKKSKPK
jgi:hypothetical protein